MARRGLRTKGLRARSSRAGGPRCAAAAALVGLFALLALPQTFVPPGAARPSASPRSTRVWCGTPRHRLAPPVTSALSATADAADAAAATEGIVNPVAPKMQKTYLNDAVRNMAFIAAIGGVMAGSWWFTGKWWKLPLVFALPSMLYRLWITRLDTEKLASVSASVDMKYVATSEKEQKELHAFMCSGCGYTLFPARGREAAFFTDNFKCPMCGASRDEFFDMSDDSDDSTTDSSDSSAAAEPAGETSASDGAEAAGTTSSSAEAKAAGTTSSSAGAEAESTTSSSAGA